MARAERRNIKEEIYKRMTGQSRGELMGEAAQEFFTGMLPLTAISKIAKPRAIKEFNRGLRKILIKDDPMVGRVVHKALLPETATNEAGKLERIAFRKGLKDVIKSVRGLPQEAFDTIDRLSVKLPSAMPGAEGRYTRKLATLGERIASVTRRLMEDKDVPKGLHRRGIELNIGNMTPDGVYHEFGHARHFDPTIKATPAPTSVVAAKHIMRTLGGEVERVSKSLGKRGYKIDPTEVQARSFARRIAKLPNPERVSPREFEQEYINSLTDTLKYFKKGAPSKFRMAQRMARQRFGGR
jgi:hypothetical protein